jgi:hypothetical protein
MTRQRAAAPLPLSTRRQAIGALAAAAALAPSSLALAQRRDRLSSFSDNEIVKTGHQFFGAVARNIAEVIQHATSRWGQPNAYVLGQEGSGAIVGGLRYGEGAMYTRNAGDRKIYWQGPSVGFDWGADGARTMMLVYNLRSVDSMYGRFVGVDGSAYFIGGLGVTALAYEDMIVAPIRAGVGARLGVNLGYLKFTDKPTWNPF